MLKLEKEILKVLKAAAGSRRQYNTKIIELRIKLIGKCSHSSIEDYLWEHDDGYGRQNMITGDRCVACNAVKKWKSSGLWH